MKTAGDAARGGRTLTLRPARDVVLRDDGAFLATGASPELELIPTPPVRGGWLDVRLELVVTRTCCCSLRLEREDDSATREQPSLGRLDASPRICSATLELGPRPYRLYLSFGADAESLLVLSATSQHRSGPRHFADEARALHATAVAPAVRAFVEAARQGGLEGAWRSVISGRVVADEASIYRRIVERDAPSYTSTRSGPLLSVLMPVFNPDPRFLEEAIASVVAQRHENWELCIADDASDRPGIRDLLKTWSQRDPRIRLKLREQRGHICAASNSALELVHGDYVALLDHDDVLHPDALAEVAAVLERGARPDMIYSDEDHLDEAGRRCRPVLKPDWSRDYLLSHMYTCHLGVYRTGAVREVGGFRPGFEGAQDHDLALRVSERGGPIVHIPRVLYHWRESSTSTAARPGQKNYAMEAGFAAVRDALARCGETCEVRHAPRHAGCYEQRWSVPKGTTVSVIIPTRDRSDLLERCISSLFKVPNEVRFDVVVVSNDSREPATHALLERWTHEQPDRFSWFDCNEPFNYSRLNNLAAARSRGDVLAFLNNDIEATQSGWLDDLAGCARRADTGAVGPMLLYPDGRIQHAGIVLGIGGAVAHVYRGQSSDTPGRGLRLLGASNASAVTGACLVLGRQRFEEAGGFDESLPYWFNDVDLCLKLRSRGLWNVLLPQVRLTHHESASLGSGLSAERRPLYTRDLDAMRSRWPEAFARDPFYGAHLTLIREDASLELS